MNRLGDGSGAAPDDQFPLISFIQTYFTVCIGEKSDKMGKKQERQELQKQVIYDETCKLLQSKKTHESVASLRAK